MSTYSSHTQLTFDSFDEALDSNGRVSDLSALRFIDAYGLVGLTMSLLATKRSGEPVHLLLPKNDGTWEHLARMGFGHVLDEAGFNYELPAAEVIDRPDVLAPIKFLHSDADVSALSELFWHQLREVADSQVLDAISEGLWELTNNALEHSGEAAIAMGQVYSFGTSRDHSHMVHIAIGDVGRGIRRSFLDAGTYTPESDAEAIDLAMEYLVSSVDDPGRGQGLSTTREATVGLQGVFSVRTGDARFTDRAGATEMTEVANLPGTLVGLVIPLRPGSSP